MHLNDSKTGTLYKQPPGIVINPDFRNYKYFYTKAKMRIGITYEKFT